MTSRRSFFKSLISLVVAPKVAAALPVAKPPINFTKVLLPMFSRTFPEFIAHDLVDAQPMSGPVGLAFHMNYGYNKI